MTQTRRLGRTAILCSVIGCIATSVLSSGDVVGKDTETAEPRRSITPAEEKTLLNGYRRYQGTCAHCHGPDGVGGSFAPSLIDSPLPYAGFKAIVENGSATGTSVMKGFAKDPNVMDHIEDIYAYLSARSEGWVGRGRPTF